RAARYPVALEGGQFHAPSPRRSALSSRVPYLGHAPAGARARRVDWPLLAQGLSGLALAAARASRHLLGLRRAPPSRRADRERGCRRAAREGLPAALRAALPDPPLGDRRGLRSGRVAAE